MDRGEFIGLLRESTALSIEFAKRYVENDLPSAVRFHVLLNQSYDGHATAEERLFVEDNGREYILSEDDVVSTLWREGRCPEWIDVAVEAHSASATLVSLCCCGRFTDDPGRMYYTREGTGPFGIKSPNLPIGFQKGTKFRLPFVRLSHDTTSGLSDLIQRLQRWYRAQCNGDWEHSQGMTISTLDNPGWAVSINLAGTSLEGRTFPTVERGLELSEPNDDWVVCRVELNRFEGRGGPERLAEIIATFLRWADDCQP